MHVFSGLVEPFLVLALALCFMTWSMPALQEIVYVLADSPRQLKFKPFSRKSWPNWI